MFLRFLCIPTFAVQLKIVRPEPEEFLSISKGSIFVIGTVEPAGAKVVCNGAPCDVSDDGAFIGFAPLQRIKDLVEREGKQCDALFHFEARWGDEETSEDDFACTLRSPSQAEIPETKFEEPKYARALREFWVGLESNPLGHMLWAPKGRLLKFESGNRFKVSHKVPSGKEMSLSTTDLDFVEKPSDEDGNPATGERSAEALAKAEPCEILIQDQKKVILHDFATGKIIEKEAENEKFWGVRPVMKDGEPDLMARESWRPPSALPWDPEHPLKDFRVCLDPGHNPDPGAVGPRGFKERESTLLIARQTASLLEDEGAIVSFTHEEEPLLLLKRHERMREADPDVVVSIHNNSAGDGEDPRKKHGSQTFYLFPWSKPLAEAMHQSILKKIGTRDMGCLGRDLYITRFPDCPAILIEPEYIILPDQEKKFMDEEYRQKLAEAIVEGLRNFALEQEQADSSKKNPE